jgi:lactate dehydrogenase-like 2-hydroxyacid dehydrogenase|tara:strand:- start:1920 stop:2873 length:954 start_codon:yes stop_codon:yes gene_type:complete
MKKILVTTKLLKVNEEKISKLWDAKLNVNNEIYSENQLIELSKDCDGILSSILDKIDKNMINKFSDKVKIISNFAVGFGNIDTEAAKKRNIIVTNTPNVLTDATAEIAILLMLGASRRVTEGIQWVKNKNWRWSADFLIGKQLSGSKLGILGMGRIGRAVAKRAKAFGMEIHYHNRSRLNQDFEEGAIYHDNIQSLFSISDILSINCPATAETEKIINKKTLKFFSKKSIIINSARGDMIDDDAMVEALKDKRIFALGLDVYNGEPNIHPGYLEHSNVFILPHLGSATERTRVDMANLAINNIEEFFKNGTCINKVN